MNISSLDGAVSITLSRRNLEQLLASLDPDLADIPTRTLVRRTEKGVLYVTAESDEYHYTGRPEGEPGPGLAPFLAGTNPSPNV